MPELTNIPCEVVGWCDYKELEEVKGIPGQDFEGTRFVRKSGLLHKTKKEWQDLVNRL